MLYLLSEPYQSRDKDLVLLYFVKSIKGEYINFFKCNVLSNTCDIEFQLSFSFIKCNKA